MQRNCNCGSMLSRIFSFALYIKTLPPKKFKRRDGFMMSVSLLAMQNLFTFYLFYYNSCLLLVGTHFHKVPSVSTFLLDFLDNQANIMIRVDVARAICKEMFFSASQTSASVLILQPRPRFHQHSRKH